MNVNSLQRDAVLKVKLINDLAFFTRYFFKEIKGDKFSLNWHHEQLFDGLLKVHKREIDVLVENLPPRHSKTELIVMFVAWSLAKNPKCAFLLISADDTLANETSSRIRDIIENETYKRLFNVRLKQDTNAKGLWRTTENGGIRAVSLGGGITGFGAGHLEDENEFYGAIIIDDPDKIANINSVKETLASELFDSTVISRRNGKRTPIIVIQQRVSLKDLTEHIISGKSKLGDFNNERYLQIKIPVLINGIPIWEQRFGIEEIEKAKRNPETGWLFDSQYMQEPIEINGKTPFAERFLKRFTLKDLEQYDIKDKQLEFSYTDIAYDGPDHFASIFVSVYDNKAYVHDVIFRQENSKVTKPLLISKLLKHKTETYGIEKNAGGSAYAFDVEEKVSLVNKNAIMYPVTAKGNKIVRIVTEETNVIDNFYFRTDYEIGSEYYLFMKYLTKFNTNMKKEDDAPDVVAGGCKAMRTYCYMWS